MNCSKCYWCEQCGMQTSAAQACSDYTPLGDDPRDEAYYLEAVKERYTTYEKTISSLM